MYHPEINIYMGHLNYMELVLCCPLANMFKYTKKPKKKDMALISSNRIDIMLHPSI